MRLQWGQVLAVLEDHRDLLRLRVRLATGGEGRAVCIPALTGPCGEGDRVLLNTTAVDLALGTGGDHFVVARGLTEVEDGHVVDQPSGGHIMKLRYTPLQIDVLSVESPESPHHELMKTAESIDGMPVVCCSLHSQVPLVAAAIKRSAPQARVGYCMTDQAALPAALSGVMRSALEAGLVDEIVTAGQAFGGGTEAVNVHSALLAARHPLQCDVAIVGIGPGVVGTSTAFGHGGVAQGEAINAAASLGGRPVACLRISSADRRARHQGVSHHSICALARVALAPSWVAVPSLDAQVSDLVNGQLEDAGVWRTHVRADSEEGARPSPPLRGVSVTTMGRGPDADPPFFSAAYAAGDIAWRLASGVLD